MPSLSGLLNDSRPLTVKYGGFEVHITYKPSAYNREWFQRINGPENEGNSDSLAQTLADSLLSWDVTNEDGSPAPITVETLWSIGLGFMSAVSDRITADMYPNRPTAATSGGGSSTTGRRG